MKDSYKDETKASKVVLYQELVQEALYNRVTSQALRKAADEAIQELLQEKKKLVESNKILTDMALELATAVPVNVSPQQVSLPTESIDAIAKRVIELLKEQNRVLCRTKI